MISMLLQTAALAAGLSAFPQSEVPRELLLFAHIKQQTAHNLREIPNYTCLETVERLERTSGSRAFKYVDSLRVEVAEIGDREVFSWPGARRFEETGLMQLVGGGLVSNGDFALIARSLFVNDQAIPTYAGQQDINGRRTQHYNYRVPFLNSGLTIRHGGTAARVAAHGAFWVDADSLELIRITEEADDIPVRLGFAEAVTTIEYAKTHIGAASVVLPQASTLVLKHFSGKEEMNRKEFTHCRQYDSLSAISFDAVERRLPVSGPPAVRLPQSELPPGLRLTLKIDAAVDLRVAHIGDSIQGRIQGDVKRKGELFVPDGAVVFGRIRRLERRWLGGQFGGHSYPTPVVIGLEFSELQSPAGPIRFFAELERVVSSLPGLTEQMTGSDILRANISLVPSGRLQYPSGRAEASMIERWTLREMPGVGTLVMQNETSLPRGLVMVWKTIKQ